MKKKLSVLFCITSVALLVLIGFRSSYHITDNDLIAIGNQVITSAIGETVKLGQKDADEIEIFPDTYKYENENHLYYVDTKDEYIRGIMPARNYFSEGNKRYSLKELETIQDQLFEKVLGKYLVGEIMAEQSGDAETGYTKTYVETIDNVETGLRSCVVVDGNGNIVAASFYKGDSSTALDFVKYPGITFDEGYQIALREVREFDKRHEEILYIGSDQVVHRQGLTQYYEYMFNYFEDGIGYLYRVKINVLTGGLVELEYPI